MSLPRPAPTVVINKGFVKPNSLSILVTNNNDLPSYKPIEFVVTGYDPVLDKFAVMNYTMNDVTQYVSGESEYIIILKFGDFTAVSCAEYQISVVISYCRGACDADSFALSASSAVLNLPFLYIAAPVIDSAYIMSTEGLAAALISDPAGGDEEAEDLSINGYSVIVHRSLGGANTMSGQFNLPFTRVVVGGTAYNLVKDIPIPVGGAVSLAARAVNQTDAGQVNVSPISNTFHLDSGARPLPPASVSAQFNYVAGSPRWMVGEDDITAFIDIITHSVALHDLTYSYDSDTHIFTEVETEYHFIGPLPAGITLEDGDVIRRISGESQTVTVSVAPDVLTNEGFVEPMAVEISIDGTVLSVESVTSLTENAVATYALPNSALAGSASQHVFDARYLTTTDPDTAYYSNSVASPAYTLAAPASVSATFVASENNTVYTATVTIVPPAPLVSPATVLAMYAQIMDSQDNELAIVQVVQSGSTVTEIVLPLDVVGFNLEFVVRYMTTSNVDTALFSPTTSSAVYGLLQPVVVSGSKNQNMTPAVTNYITVPASDNPSLIGRLVSLQLYRDSFQLGGARSVQFADSEAAEVFSDADAMDPHEYYVAASDTSFVSVGNMIVTIAAATEPPAPASVDATHSLVGGGLASAFNVVWEAAEDDSIQVAQYRVYVSVDGSDDVEIGIVNAATRSLEYRVTPSDNTAYVFGVEAVGVNTLVSEKTTSAEKHMPRIMVPLALNMRQWQAEGGISQVELSWSAPSNIGGEDDQAYTPGYVIPVGPLTDVEIEIPAGTLSILIDITSSMTEAPVDQTVQARGTDGTRSDPVSFPNRNIPLSLPSPAPQTLRLSSTQHSIRATWLPPVESVNPAAEYWVRLLQNGIPVAETRVQPHVLEYTFNGLTIDTMYVVQVSLTTTTPGFIYVGETSVIWQLWGQVAERAIDTVGPPIVTLESALPAEGSVSFIISGEAPLRNLAEYSDMRYVYYVPVVEKTGPGQIDAFTSAPVINVLASNGENDTSLFNFVYIENSTVHGNQYRLTVKNIVDATFVGFIVVVVTVDQSCSYYVPTGPFVSATVGTPLLQ